MSNKIYNWKRFWCPREGNINLSDGGFLYDPDSDFGHAFNPDVVSFESIEETPCLILLGEPGIGKTQSMRLKHDLIKTKIKSEGDEILWINLNSIGSEFRLMDKIFRDRIFDSWMESKYKLHIFLDSLDECQLKIDTVTSILFEELKNYRIERLYLRICCRTADWRNSFENELKKLWSEKSVGVYELVPLRRIDIIEAAKMEGLNSKNFIDAIYEKEIVPLAIKPITLKILLNIFKRESQFPLTQAELYLEGCKRLCEETNEKRRESRHINSFSVDQKLAVAGRISAVTIFSNHFTIWKDLDEGNILKEDIYYKDLCGGFENVNGEQFKINENVIKETLGTGLFSSRGPHRMGWSHQTYAEFLSAYYLIKNNVDIEQILSLIKHPNTTEGKLVPQLHETAAWLAGMNSEIFKNILSGNPEVLLKSDISKIDKKDIKYLVDKLLMLFEKDELNDDLEIRFQYNKLNHHDLSKQLQPHIFNRKTKKDVRRVAIDIAEACNLRSLQKGLANIALDQNEDYSDRKNAAFAVSRIADDETKLLLKPLLMINIGEDPDDELKGCTLKALWPNHLTVKELLKLLTQPKKPDLFGIYKVFIYDDILPHLKIEDLPAVLKWIENKGWNKIRRDPFEKLIKDIFILSWKNLDKSAVLAVFSKTIVSLIINYANVVGTDYYNKLIELIETEVDKRRLLTKTIIPLISKLIVEQKILDLFSPIFIPLVTYDDLFWTIEQFNVASDNIKPLWVELIDNSFDRKDSESIEKIYEAHKKNSLLEERFKNLYKEIDLNSPEAKKQREYYNKYLKRSSGDIKKKFLSPSPSERILKFLCDFENNNYNAWWHLCQVLTLKPDSTHFENEIEADLTILPGWKSSNIETKARILSAAKVYIENKEPNIKKWLDNNTWYYSDYAGYKSIVLIWKKDKNYFSSISENTWKKWAPVIISYPTHSGDDKGLHEELVKIAYEKAPEEIIEYLLIMIDRENEVHNFIDSINKVKKCWNNQLACAMFQKVKDNALKPENMADLLGELLAYGFKDAITYAESVVQNSYSKIGDQFYKSVFSAIEIMTYTENASWSFIWPLIQKKENFGKEIVSKLAHRYDTNSDKILQKLNEEQLEEFYIWLVNQYPYSEDPKIEGVHSVGIREMIARFRDSVLLNLKAKGTQKACKLIGQIKIKFPELKGIKRILLEAQNIALQKTWIPPLPEDILKLFSDRKFRLVETGNQLSDVIIESLKLLEKKLHRDTPAVFDLWNEIKENRKTIYSPKDETSLSDYVKRHLVEDIKNREVIVNREVEIHKSIGKGTGKKTDIKIDTLKKDKNGQISGDSLSVIMEVKGCWNKELLTAMETQLLNRYMKQNKFNYGIYLVGWFNCDKWDDSDARKKNANKYNFNELKEKLDAQAYKLSQQNVTIKAFVMDTSL